MPLPRGEKWWGRPPHRWKGALQGAAATFSDIAKTELLALKESVGVFPPLKSVTGHVHHVWDIAERTKSANKDAKALALRYSDILQVIHGAIPEPDDIPQEMLENLSMLERLLDEINRPMESMQARHRLARFTRLNPHCEMMIGFHRRLDEARRDLIIASMMRIEVKVSQMEDLVSRTEGTISTIKQELDTKLDTKLAAIELHVKQLLITTVGLF